MITKILPVYQIRETGIYVITTCYDKTLIHLYFIKKSIKIQIKLARISISVIQYGTDISEKLPN